MQEELESVSGQLHKLKEKLDELLQAKVLLDEESTSLSNEIQDSRSNKNSETNAIGDIERDIRKVKLNLETLEEKKGAIQNENEQLDSVWGKMKTSFEEALHKSQSENKESEDLFSRLEHIKSEKERIMSEDHVLELRKGFKFKKLSFERFCNFSSHQLYNIIFFSHFLV